MKVSGASPRRPPQRLARDRLRCEADGRQRSHLFRQLRTNTGCDSWKRLGNRACRFGTISGTSGPLRRPGRCLAKKLTPEATVAYGG